MTSNGKLYVVATPIGNLNDLSNRAKATLGQVHWIAAEDTRCTYQLLESVGLKNTCHSLHHFNESKQLPKLISLLQNGENGALVSDAGTPMISDPGFKLVQACHEAQIDVIPVPGPCAAVAAVSALAVQEGGFLFEGFLPAKSSQRVKRLNELRNSQHQIIFYEAPHRIGACIDDLCEVFGGQRKAGIAREITKKFESYYVGSLDELKKAIEDETVVIKGEFVVVVEGAQEEEKAWQGSEEKLAKVLLAHLPPNKVAKVLTEMTQLDRKTSYELALKMKND